jgi:GNAT superfamily N-acetyltransferase
VGQPVTTLRRVQDPADPALRELATLLHATFPDPDTVLELDRMQAFLAEQPGQTGRQFCVVVAEEGGVVLGGTVFSYVAASNCGFSEYLVVRTGRHGQGLGRRLVDARRALLADLAGQSGQPGCHGLFIEVDNPRRTPSDLQARERETAMDATARLQLFAHLGFLRVDIAYTQPPLGPGKLAVSYLDLLFAPWDERARDQRSVAADWIADMVCPIWTSWAPAHASRACAALRQKLGGSPVALVPLSCDA